MKLTTKEKLQRIQQLRPIDDVFFEVLARNPEVCQEILRTILEDAQLIVNEVVTQSSEKNLYGRSVRLDALCTLGTGTKCNIEVQRSDNDDHLRRVRFNASSITVRDSDIGDKFEDVIELYVIYISEFDIFGGGKAIYHVDKVLRETGTVVDDGLHEIFVNTVIDDGTDIAELMRCFTQTTVTNPKFPALSREVGLLKTDKGGISIMSNVMKDLIDEAVTEAMTETTIKLCIDFGCSDAQIIEQLQTRCALTETEAKTQLKQFRQNN